MQRSSSFITQAIRWMLPRNVRNTIRRPSVTIQSLLAKWARSRGEIIEVSVLPGWKVSCHPICRNAFGVFHSDPEQELELQCFVKSATEGMHLIDVGAHWGMFTLAALHYGGTKAQVIGIEASDGAVEIYRDNLAINRVSERVIVVNAACGAFDGEVEMLTTGSSGGDYFVVPAGQRIDSLIVPQVSVDSVVESHAFKPTHIKIDVEGFEEEVLRGAANTLQKIRPDIFMELHGPLIRQRGMRPEMVLQQLTAHGYTDWQQLNGEPLTIDDLKDVAFSARFVAKHA